MLGESPPGVGRGSTGRGGQRKARARSSLRTQMHTHTQTWPHRERAQSPMGMLSAKSQAKTYTETQPDVGCQTQASTHSRTAPSTVSPTPASHSGHCAQLCSSPKALLAAQPLTPHPLLLPQEDRTGGWRRGQPRGLAQGPAAKRGSRQPEGRPLRRGCQGNRLLRNQPGA